jgi:6-phospho-beta-glucosidase
MKISIIGAGSTYTPELIEGVAEGRLGAPIDELLFMDVDAERLQILGALARRMFDRAGWPGRLTLTTSRAEALDGVDACLLQFRIGGSAARVLDESIPLTHGVIGQETVGPGGWASALRTIPPALEIAEELARRSPKAWLLDFANPVSIVSQALISEGHRAVGLCNVAIGVQRIASAHLGVEPQRVEVESAGLNHAAWYRDIRVDGVSKFESLLLNANAELAEFAKVPGEELQRERAVPSYYLRYYREAESVLAEQRASGTRGGEVARIESELLNMFKDPQLDRKPELLERRGGAYYSTAALDLIAALTGVRPARLVVNVRNGGAIPDLPSDLVIEALSDVSADGARPIRIPPLGGARKDLILQLGEFGVATAVAAASRDRVAALRALARNPLIKSNEEADAIGTELLAAHTRFF